MNRCDRPFAIMTTSLLGVSLALPGVAIAQVTPDGRTPTGVTGSCRTTCTVTGGSAAGRNLFHSFDRFSIPNNGTLQFSNAPNVQNIFSRITGTSRSSIDGEIQANGSANVFLINPNGIIFGPNARLNIGGSFIATTANALQFGDRGFFTTDVTSTNPTLLTVNPSALLFDGRPQPIVNRSTVADPSLLGGGGLQVREGRSLLFVGGDITLEGGRLTAPGGRVELGAIAAPGSVDLTIKGDRFGLLLPEGVSRANITLNNLARLWVAAGGGGTIRLFSHHLNLVDASILQGGIFSGRGNLSSQAGPIVLDATGRIRLDDSSRIVTQVNPTALGHAGDIIIRANSLEVLEGSLLMTTNFNQGEAGEVRIRAREGVLFEGLDDTLSGIYTQIAGAAPSQAGDIDIRAGSLTVNRGAVFDASTFGQGDAGDIQLTIRDRTHFDGFRLDSANSRIIPSSVVTEVTPGATGQGGDISITTGSLSLSNFAVMFANTFGRGNAGNIQINARDQVLLTSSVDVSSNVREGAIGKGGNIHINAGSLAILAGSQLVTSTNGSGSAGNIQIETRGPVLLEGESQSNIGGIPTVFTSAIISQVGNRGVGNGGQILVRAESLFAQNGAGLSTGSLGQGNAGDITIRARDRILFDGSDSIGGRSGAFSAITRNAVGQGGDITIQARDLTITNVAGISSSNLSDGNAGDITVQAQRVNLLERGAINAVTYSAGSGGNLTLQDVDLLVLRTGGLLNTEAGVDRIGGGNGGNITIDSDFVIAVPQENSDIVANAFGGAGGNIQINTQSILGIEPRQALFPRTNETNDITASSEFGIDGAIAINRPDVDPGRGLIELPTNPVDASQLIAQTCAADQRADGAPLSEFVVTGRGGLPPTPGEPLSDDESLIEWATRTPLESAAPSIHVTAAPLPVEEAQGWAIGTQGEIQLTADAPAVVSPPGVGDAHCHS